jgi:hypothetical protein
MPELVKPMTIKYDNNSYWGLDTIVESQNPNLAKERRERFLRQNGFLVENKIKTKDKK